MHGRPTPQLAVVRGFSCDMGSYRDRPREQDGRGNASYKLTSSTEVEIRSGRARLCL